MYYMIYTAKITSKGTTTIPADLRRKLGLKTGSEVAFSSTKKGEITIERVPTIEELRLRAQAEMTKQGTTDILKNYKSGDGFTAHVKEKYASYIKP